MHSQPSIDVNSWGSPLEASLACTVPQRTHTCFPSGPSKHPLPSSLTRLRGGVCVDWLQPPCQPLHSNPQQYPKSTAACLIALSLWPLLNLTPRGPLSSPGPDPMKGGRVFQKLHIWPIRAEALGRLALATLSQTALTCHRWPQEAGTSLLPQLPVACPLGEMAMDTTRSRTQLTLVRVISRLEKPVP